MGEWEALQHSVLGRLSSLCLSPQSSENHIEDCESQWRMTPRKQCFPNTAWLRLIGMHRDCASLHSLSKPDEVPEPRRRRGHKLLPISKKLSPIDSRLQRKIYLFPIEPHWVDKLHLRVDLVPSSKRPTWANWYFRRLFFGRGEVSHSFVWTFFFNVIGILFAYYGF